MIDSLVGFWASFMTEEVLFYFVLAIVSLCYEVYECQRR